MNSPPTPPPLPPPSGQWAHPADEKGPKKKYLLWLGLGGAGCLAILVGLGWLASGLVSLLVRKYTQSVQEEARAELLDLRGALEIWAQVHGGRYPASLDALVAPDAQGHTLLRDERELPRDPWERKFLYDPPSAERREPRLYTLGADGRPGGSGLDADIESVAPPPEER